MLFNSYEFLFLFLPVTLLGFHLIGKKGHHRVAIAWLVGASLFFYGWWNPAYLGLMLFSILFNYSIGISLNNSYSKKISKKTILMIGVSINLLVLGYYKYANFFVDNLNVLSDSNIVLHKIILPLAISFFTFQQISYLIDTYKGETKEYNFLHYCLFVTFFPQLIAGPIVHHKEMLPQFIKDSVYKIKSENLAVGITIFTLGLFKKVVLADSIAKYSSVAFDASEVGVVLTFFEAWSGALAYTFQLYFDFSGYSDMAIGIARMFGIRLPVNFNSPYKSTSIIDFWKRWHITLSRFLRDYLYIPLGGSRKGQARRYINLIITMVLGGLWHGAGWTFVLWGTMHGFYLIINHAWRSVFPKKIHTKTGRLIAWLITFLAIVVAWVPFRAENIASAKSIMCSMMGMNEILLSAAFNNHLYSTNSLRNGLLLGLIIVLTLPNVQQFMSNYQVESGAYKGTNIQKSGIKWKPTIFWLICIVFILFFTSNEMSNVSEFLYFKF